MIFNSKINYLFKSFTHNYNFSIGLLYFSK